MTQTRLGRVLLSPFIFWIALLIGGSYLMFSFDAKVLRETQAQPGVWGTVQRYYQALKLNYIKKGTDLAGGTYLVLGVEVEKAIENRLGVEGRNLDSLFKSKNLEVLPTDKKVVGLTFELTFPDEKAAGVALNLIRDSHVNSLKVVRNDAVLVAQLAPDVEQSIRTGAVEQAVSVLTNRLGGYGVEGIIVQQHGDRQVVVQLPGIVGEDPEHIKSVITKTAHLEFKIVEKTAASREALLDDFQGELPADKMVIPGRSEGDETARRWYLVSAFADLTGDHLVSAKVDYDEFNRTVVTFKLDSVGAREFAALTTNNVGRQLGIIIDNVMFTAPNVHEPITGGGGSISGVGVQKEAADLALVLRSGALKAPLKFEHENRVGAELGQDSIYAGILSCLVSLLLLFVFSIFYYKIPGLFAILALLMNLFISLLLLSYFRATLTLPGIAGMVVGIGMAIDASVLIFEQTKEFLAAGVPLRKAVEDGFSGVLSVILDSNITTFLTGLVLFHFGGPAIRGFAVTLMAGIVATVFAGVYFLKSLFLFVFDTFGVTRMKF